MDHWVDKHVGLKIRQRRWMVGLSRERLAERVGCPAHQVSNYESGAAAVGAGLLWEIATELEVPMRFFFLDADGWPPDDGEATAQILPEAVAQRLVSRYYAMSEDQRRRLSNLASVLEAAV